MMRLERLFWRCWLGGLLLLALMIALNLMLATPASPMGIADHQAATNAATVDVIQQAWQAIGKLWLAQLSMAIDLIYIAIYGAGAFAGGLLFYQNKHALLRRLGLMTIIATLIYVAADYIETICQFVQAMQYRGSDLLAGIASTARPVKSITFLITMIALLAAIIIRRTASRAA